ncbi:MAG: transporter substrate-binding domain-containing protein [Lachnospiraceae bacterium]|nr:transporter substrate-binding domain-containing protein [Lachnospiraceae bacterium]
MKQKKLSIILAFILVLLMSLTGCSGTSTTDHSSTEKKDYTIKITDDIQTIIDRGYLIVGVKTDVPGFGYYDKETKTYSGMEIDLAYQVAAKIFDTTPDKAKKEKLVTFVKATVENRSTLLVENSVDCVIATYTITSERKKTFAFSDSYYSDAIGIMVKKDYSDNNSLGTGKITSVHKLDGKKVGVAKNADTRAHMLKYFKQRNYNIAPIFMEYSSYQQLYNALKDGTIDAFAVDTSILNGYVDDGLTILPDRFAQQDYGVAASKDHQGLIDAINIVIDEYGY